MTHTSGHFYIYLFLCSLSFRIYIIYTCCFSSVRRKMDVAKQNYRCAGCGTRIDPGMTSKPKYFIYLISIYTLLQLLFLILFHEENFNNYFLSFSAGLELDISRWQFWLHILTSTHLCLCNLSALQIISSDCGTVNTSAVTSASAAMRTPRRWYPAEC